MTIHERVLPETCFTVFTLSIKQNDLFDKFKSKKFTVLAFPSGQVIIFFIMHEFF